jgi:hypothetical protein
VTDRYGVLLPPDLPAGRYPLIVGLYHIVTGERLPVSAGGDHAVLGEVELIHSVESANPAN